MRKIFFFVQIRARKLVFHYKCPEKSVRVRSEFRTIMREMFRSGQRSVGGDVKEKKQSVGAVCSGVYQSLNQIRALQTYSVKWKKQNCSHCSYFVLKMRLVDTTFFSVLAHFPHLSHTEQKGSQMQQDFFYKCVPAC